MIHPQYGLLYPSGKAYDFYAVGVMKLQENNEKCVRLEGDYFENCDFA